MEKKGKAKEIKTVSVQSTIHGEVRISYKKGESDKDAVAEQHDDPTEG